jgi:hypothetical protein
MAPMLKTANATATAAATMASVDNFIVIMCFAVTPSEGVLSIRRRN